MNVAALDDAIAALERWGRERDWLGSDPYEGMNARRAAVLKRTPMGRRVLIQAVKRSPLDLRRLLGVDPRHNPAALGHVLAGYARMPGISDAVRRERCGRIVELLAGLRVEAYDEPAWAYPFDVETRVFGYPRTTPNTIATGFCGLGLLAAHEALGDPRALSLAEGTGDFFLRHITQTPSGEGAYFGYFPGDRTEIHNASMLASGLLAALARATGREDFGAAAGRGAAYAVAHQRSDGSWPYGERADLRWVDNHHTGYVLDSLLRCMTLDDDPRLAEAYDRGLRFYRDRFFAGDGRPRFFADREWPVDSQCLAQSLTTLAEASRRDPGALGEAWSVLGFALRRMRRSDGAFIFQRLRAWRISTPHLRWTQAPMFDALTLLARRAREAGAR